MADPQWQSTNDHVPLSVSAPSGGWQVTDGPDKAQWQSTDDHAAVPENYAQRALDFTTNTLRAIPSSGGAFLSNLYNAGRHPLNTGSALGKIAVGTLQKLTPDTPSHANRGYVPYADAAGQALKDRYGSLDALGRTIQSDPVGVMADASTVVGGAGAAARGVGLAADAAGLSSVADAANGVADTAGAVSNAVNPLTLPAKAVGSVTDLASRGFVRSALGLTGRTERYGATPAQAALEETSGVTPSAVATSARNRLTELSNQLDALPATRDPDLSSARQVIRDAIKKVQAGNGDPSDLAPMLQQLTEPKPGFTGTTALAANAITPGQTAPVFLGIKRQFGSDFTKFDQARPVSSAARNVGNQAYHALSTEFNSAVPGAADINQTMQSLIPVQQAAESTSHNAGAVERSINRVTRPTGALVAAMFGLREGGIPGMIAALAGQETAASPVVKMGVARGLYAAGKGMKSPASRKAATMAAVAGAAAGSTNDVGQSKTPASLPATTQPAAPVAQAPEQAPALTESAVRKMALDAGKDPDAVVDAARKNKLLQ